jgi:glycosyltransferase involved in cell wall biosynthesis
MGSRPSTSAPRRITLVADELRGIRGGGLGTATTFLGVALARMGHRVDVLYVGGTGQGQPDADWSRLYDEVGLEVRTLPRRDELVEPREFGRLRDIATTLADDPPDVLITQDLAAPAYVALQLRATSLAFPTTLFVVFCHGTRQWITDVSRKVRVLPGALAVSVLERASVELADVIVSPSAYMLEWMRRQGWRLPAESHVVPYVTRSAATGELQQRAVPGDDVKRVTFFGRLEERKGLKPFIAGVNALDPALLARIELEFLGSATPAWPPSRIETMFTAPVRTALRGVSFQTTLDQNEALAHLSEPGTLAVIPSLEDNSPNTVYECLDRGIPFIAGDTGGASELIAGEDRGRVLFEPTPTGVAAALRSALSGPDGLRAVSPSFDPESVIDRWAEIVARSPRMRERAAAHATDVDVVVGDWNEAANRTSDWVLRLDAGDEPDDALEDTLLRAQAATGADVVTCAVRAPADGGAHAEHYFVGDPGALGLLSNAYGSVALVRRSLLKEAPPSSSRDPDWPVLARLAITGARVVSVPIPLVTCARHPGTLTEDPTDALLVAQAFERAVPVQLRAVARLAAGLAAGAGAASPQATNGRLRRVRSAVRSLRLR